MVVFSDFFAASSPWVSSFDVKLGSDGVFVEVIGDSDVISAWGVRSSFNVSEQFFIVGDVESGTIKSLALVVSQKNL